MKLDKDYHVLKGVLYKQGSPPAMMIDLSSKREWETTACASPDSRPTVEEIRRNFVLRTDEVSAPPGGSTSELKSCSSAKPGAEPAIKKGVFLCVLKKH